VSLVHRSKDKETWLVMDLDSARPRTAAVYEWRGMKDGMRAAFSLAGLVMACSFVGYGAFLHSIAFGLLPGLFTTLIIWALPGQVVFADLWMKQAGLVATALAVTLTAVRLLPMTVLVLSRARLQGVRRWPEFLVAHFTAITMWVIATAGMETVGQARRIPWLLGLATVLVSSMLAMTAIGYFLAEALPPSLAATLVYFTPAFFLMSLFGSAYWRFDYWAILLGAALAPLAGALAPRFDLLIAGLVGGTIAFFLARPAGLEDR
jgi:predicted branched-subunit amino acid permease